MVYDTYSEPGSPFLSDVAATGLQHLLLDRVKMSGAVVRLISSPFVEVIVGHGNTTGAPVPKPFTEEITGEGSAAMGFYNVQNGDAPYMLQLAQQYTLDDDFHQSIMGGTGANHIALGTGDAIWFSDGNGNSAVPPEKVQVYTGTPDQGAGDRT